MTIWKYQIPLVDEFTLRMPKGACILTVQAQNNHGCLWAMLNPEAEPEERRFCVVGTGDPMPPGVQYVGTYQQEEGMFVWHVFEVTP